MQNKRHSLIIDIQSLNSKKENDIDPYLLLPLVLEKAMQKGICFEICYVLADIEDCEHPQDWAFLLICINKYFSEKAVHRLFVKGFAKNPEKLGEWKDIFSILTKWSFTISDLLFDRSRHDIFDTNAFYTYENGLLVDEDNNAVNIDNDGGQPLVVIDGNDGLGKSTLIFGLENLGYVCKDRGLPTKMTDDLTLRPDLSSSAEVYLILDAPVEISQQRLLKAGRDLKEKYHTKEDLTYYRQRFVEVVGILGIKAVDANNSAKEVLRSSVLYLCDLGVLPKILK